MIRLEYGPRFTYTMKGLEIKITPVLVWGIQILLWARFVGGSSWYSGCVHNNASSHVSESFFQNQTDNAVFTPSTCARSCHERGFLYAGLQDAYNCGCSNNIEAFGERIADEHCNITCGNASLPCGGDNAVSIYLVEGPYLLTVELSRTQHLVQEGTAVRFEARVSLAVDTVTDIGVDGLNNSHFENIAFVWSVDGEVTRKTSHRHGNSSIIDSFVHSFNHHGKWQIDVEVRNTLSSLARTTSITVVRPLPSDLQVILQHTQGDNPSCVPVSDSTPSLPVVAVFVGEEVEFQASVAMGTNLTFMWMFEGCDGINTTEQFTEDPECQGIACLQDTQIYTFFEEGRYSVVVNTSNHLGSVRQMLHVVVVNREITNLTMSLSSDSAYINEINSSLGLLISVTTSARHQALLEVDFGDGFVYNYSMYDVNDTFITVGDEDNRHPYLTASYGEGCTLSISFSHTYRHSGAFTIEAKVFQLWSNQSIGSTKLDSAVIVQQKLGQVTLEMQQVYSTHSLANFTLLTPVTTANMTYSWSVSLNNETVYLDCPLEPTCLHNFTEPGHYVLGVTVSNLVSVSHAHKSVLVQVPVSRLVLTGGRSGILATATTVQFAASVHRGSDVHFLWQFSDILGTTEQQNSLLDSHANHTYYSSGVYNVSVMASNQVSSVTAHFPEGIIIQDPVLGLGLVSTGPTILTEPTHVNVTLLQGTHVTISAHTEEGPLTPDIEFFEDDRTYFLELLMRKPGVFHVTVTASNDVSSENGTICVIVQERIGTVSIRAIYPGKSYLVLLVNLNGNIPERTDVVYKWQVRGENRTSASPILQLSTVSHPELVTVQASNRVDVAQAEITVESNDMQTLYSLDCPSVAKEGTPITMTLQISGNTTSILVDIIIDHGDDSSNASYTVSTDTPLIWNHTYQWSGVYLVRLWFTVEEEDVQAQTVTVIQTPISSMRLMGPQISKFLGSLTMQTWEAILLTGTHILYTWTIVPIETGYSHGTETSRDVIMPPVRVAGSHGKVSIPFYAPGHYNISLEASNLISSVVLHTETTLQQSIIHANVLVDPTLVGTSSMYQVMVKGGPPFQFKIDFGTDVESVSVGSEELALLGNEIIDYLFDPPMCVYMFNVTYPSLGWYESSFRINNLVSEESVSVAAKVEEWITGLTLWSWGPSLVTVGHAVILEASVETGNEIDFTWSFQDEDREAIIQNHLNVSRATHTFSRPGSYQVSITVSNYLQPQPLTITYPEPFLVQKPVFALELKPPLGHFQGAALYDYGDHRATYDLAFRAQCSGSHIVFYFDYGDGTVERVDGMPDTFGLYFGHGSHQYVTEGNYSVSVTAGNQLGNETRHLARPYYIQVPLVNPRCAQSYYTHISGTTSHLSVITEMGSQLLYNWSMGDQTDYIAIGPSVSHMYRSSGIYWVTVVVYNKIDRADVTCTVSIEDCIQGVQLVVEKTLYETLTRIAFHAVTVTDSALRYQWDMGDGQDAQMTSINTLTYWYSFPRRYYVTVLASNHVSNATSQPVELTLQTAIRQVAVLAHTATLVDQSTQFEARLLGSDVNLVWDFGDGTDKVDTTDVLVYHTYNRTGEFVIHLEASNLISNGSTSAKIFVLTRMCCPPALDIVGDDPRSVKRSEDIRIEAEVRIDCDITNVAQYTWVITHAGNWSVVELDPTVASLDQRTLFIPRRHLPYGSYLVSLDVAMNGTIVYSQDSVNIQVTKSTLRAIIEGGTRRYFNRDMIATLNGSLSYDPDNPAAEDLTYTWTCHPLVEPASPCFNVSALSTIANGTFALPSYNSFLTFPVAWLLRNSSSSFVFALRVGKEDRGHAEVTQVVTLVQEMEGLPKRLQVSIDCPKCQNGIINSNDRLTMEALCPNCNTNTTYAWELYVVLDGTISDSFFASTSAHRCSEWVMSHGQYLIANDSSQSMPSANPEEDGNIINQSTQTTATFTSQNVGNVIDPGVTAVAEIAGPPADLNSTLLPNQTGVTTSEGSTSLPVATVSRRTDHADEDMQGGLGGSFQEELGGSVPEETHPIQEEEGLKVAEDVGNSSVGLGIETENSTELAVTVGEAGGTYGAGDRSFEEDDGGIEAAMGNLTAATQSFQETGVNDTVVMDTSPEHPETASTNATDRSLLETVAPANGSVTDPPNGPQDHPSTPEDASNSNHEHTSGMMGQDIENTSQPVAGYDESVYEYDYYEADSEEYLSLRYDPGLDPPSPPDSDTSQDDNNGGDPVANPDIRPVIKEHLVSKSLQQRIFRPENTTTGLTGRALTIREGMLEENKTYALVVHVQSRENGVVKIGEAHQYVFINTGPRAGLCSFTPVEGNEMDTFFTINCYGWQDKHDPIQYEVSYSLNETEDLAILYFGMRRALKFQLPAGYADNGHKVYIKVAIVDGLGGKTTVCSLSIKVLPKIFNPGQSIEEFLYNMTVGSASFLMRYVEQGDHYKLSGLISMVACVLNHQPTLTEGTDNYTKLLSLRRQIRCVLVSAVLSLPLRDQFEIQQSSSTMAASCYVSLELQVKTVIMASRSIDLCKDRVLANLALVGELDVDILVALTSIMSSVVSALDMEHTESIGLEQRKAVIEVSIGAVAQLLQSYLQQQKADEETLFIQSSSVDLLGARQSSLLTVNLTAGQNAFLLPSTIEQDVYSRVLQNTRVVMGSRLYPKAANPCWDVDMVTYQANPYTWGEGANKVTTGVSSLNLRTCAGLELKVDNLTAGQEIIFEVLHSCGSSRDSLTCNLTIDKAFMNIHEFNVSEENMGQTFQILVRLSPEARRTFPLQLIMSYDRRPTPTSYDRSWLYENEGEDLVIFLPPNTFNKSGTYYLALIDAEYGSSSYRQEEVRVRQYLIRVWWGECLYWNTDVDAWIGDGCELMESSTYEKTRCKCNHLTSFSVTFLPVSLLLDFVNLALFEKPNANPITSFFTAGTLSVFIVLFIYCYFADKHDEKKRGLIYLWDNQPSDQRYYEITVETGMRTGAGTTARVSVVLHGEEGHSETKELVCSGRPVFEKNSRDRFIVSVPESLGNIHRVHVWHNNAGHSPSWYLSRIAVRDLITGQKWYFICERWFAVEEDDGKIERELEVLSNGVGFQKAFFAKLFQYFADYYLWSSIFTRPPYSVFTRVQRLTCCLSISMGFMCINTVWYQHLDKQEAELGLIDVSLEAVLVGIVTALLAIPINFPIIMIFRRAKPHSETSDEDNYRSVKATTEFPESAAPVETILNHGRLFSGAEEQSDVTLEDLQEWAQEKWKNRLKGSFSHGQNSHGSFESLSFSSGMYDDNNDDEEILSSNSISNTSNKLHPEEISDSGVSSPVSGSLRSCGYVTGCRQADHKRLSNPKIWLPSWWRMLAWVVCIIITIFSALVSIYYGYSFSHVKSVYWMQSLYFSFLQCIFVTQPAVMLMFTIVKSVRHRNNIHIFDHYDDNIDLIDKKSLERSRLETYEQDVDKAIAVRQRSRYLRFARPPQEKELQKAKQKMLKEKNMWAILKDMIMYSTLFVCLMWMTYGRDVAYHHPVNQGIQQTFLKTPHPFTNISSISDLWLWLQDDLVDALYWEKWYNGEAVQEGKHPIMNGESILLGKVSLRQMRVRHQSCQVAKPTQSLFHDCRAGYTPGVRSTKPYGPGQSWTHSWRHELKRYVKWGYFGSYEGDGFVVMLNNTREEALMQLEFLWNNSWIDDQTRAIIVEFTIYNAPTNLYTAVGLLAEMPGTGAINLVPKIESVLLYRYETMYDYFIMCCELLFLLLVAVSGKREVQRLVKIRAAYFKSTWSWMEMGLIILSLTYFVMYVCRFMYVNDATHRLRITYMEEFVDMSLLAFWDQILKDLQASLIFLVTVKLMRLLRFNQTVTKFGAVIDGAIKEILSFVLYLVILEAAFACLGVLLFSIHFYPLKHLYISTNLLNAMIVGHPSDYQDVQAQFPMLWRLFYFSYTVTMTIFMAGLIKAILCQSYRQVKQHHVDAVGGKEVVCFFWQKFLVYIGLRQLPEEEKPATLPTEYTMAEIEYQVDELLFRMTALSHQHGLPQKPYGYYDDSDGTHGMMEDGLSSTCSELNLSDNTRLEDRVQKIETHLYSQNPELRELLDGNCFTDEDTEKQLRAHLEMEIFRHLQLQRQEEYRLQHELHDSGHDTQSTSEHMELGSDNTSLDQQRAPFNVSNVQEQSDCSKPSQNLGAVASQPSTHLLSNRKQAWGQPSLGRATQDKHPQKLQNTGITHQRPLIAGNMNQHKVQSNETASASMLKKDRQLSSSEVLDSQSTSSFDLQRTDSLSSHASDLVTSKVNAAPLGSSRSWIGGVTGRRRSKPRLEELVCDHQEGIESAEERPVSVESFPLPNALEGLSGSSGNEKGKLSKKHKSKNESKTRHRLRKTRSRGKGKGRCHYSEGAYFNEAFSTDGEDEVPVIKMGQAAFFHSQNGV